MWLVTGARALLVATVVAGGACNRKQSSTPSCADAAQRGVDVMVGQARGRLAAAQVPAAARLQMEARVHALELLGPRLVAATANRCTDDRWQPATIRCYASASSLDEVRACRDQLTAEQRATLQADELAVQAGASGPLGFGSGAPSDDPDQQRVVALRGVVNEAMKLVAAAQDDAGRVRTQASLLAKRSELLLLEAELAVRPGGLAEPADSGETTLERVRRELDVATRELSRLAPLIVPASAADLASARTNLELARSKLRAP